MRWIALRTGGAASDRDGNGRGNSCDLHGLSSPFRCRNFAADDDTGRGAKVNSLVTSM
jgi:hypothetical protein